MAGRVGSRNTAPILSVRPGPGYASTMRTALFLAGMLLSLAAQPQEIYRWVDKDGIVHYADQPGAPDAKLVEMAGLNIYEAQPAEADGGATANEQPQLLIYDSLVIVQPAPDQVFFGADASVQITAELGGTLQPDHTVAFFMNGNRVLGSNGLSAQLSNLSRGTYLLHATVLDRNGAPVVSSQTVTFHVRQPSVNAPQSPQNRPPPKPAPQPAPVPAPKAVPRPLPAPAG